MIVPGSAEGKVMTNKKYIEGFIRQLNTTLDFCRETLKHEGIEVGGEEYKAYLKAVSLGDLVEVMTNEFTGSSLRYKPDAKMSQRSIAKKRIVLISIHLIELCKKQICDLNQLSELKASDFINVERVQIYVSSLLVNQWDIDNLACGLGLPSVERGAVSRSQRKRTEGTAKTNERLVEKAARQILNDDNLKSVYLYQGGKRDGKLRTKQLAIKLEENLTLKQGTIESHIRNLIANKLLP